VLHRWIVRLTPTINLPALVVARPIGPTTENDIGAMVLVIQKGVEVEVDAVQRADAPEAMPHIATLCPQHRFVHIVWVVRQKLHLGTSEQ
jgi:hypothetical protein